MQIQRMRRRRRWTSLCKSRFALWSFRFLRVCSTRAAAKQRARTDAQRLHTAGTYTHTQERDLARDGWIQLMRSVSCATREVSDAAKHGRQKQGKVHIHRQAHDQPLVWYTLTSTSYGAV
jgi:hypothetical protein